MGCKVTLVNKNWLLRYLLGQKINTISTLLKIGGIGAFKPESAEFAILSLYFPSKNNVEQLLYASVRYKIHLVDGLHANLLIENDILSPEGFIINIGKKSALIGSCAITIPVNAKQQGQFLLRRLLAGKESVIPSYSEVMISLVKVPLLDDCNFLFHLTIQPNLTLYAHILDHETSKILVRNTSNQPLRIPRHHMLGHLLDIVYKNCFFANTPHDSAAIPPFSHPFSDLSTRIPLPPADSSMETVLENDIKIYGNETAVK